MEHRLSRRALLATALLAPHAPIRASGQVSPVVDGVPMYRGNPARTGEHSGPGPAGEPVPLWQLLLGKMISCSPAVAGGLVYIGSISPGTRDGGAFHAVDAATGIERWRVITAPGDGFFSSPAVVDGVAVIGSYDGIVVAADAATGAERWRFQASTTFYGSPAIVAGVVFVADTGGTLYALDLITGAERWRVAHGDGSDRAFGSPAVADGGVYGIDAARRMYEVSYLRAYDAVTGQERWRYTPEAGINVRAVAVVADGTVFARTLETFVIGVDAATGEERSRYDLGAPVLTDFAVAGGVIYAGTEDGVLHAIEASTGAYRWKLPLTQGAAVIAAPAVAGGTVYANDADGMLHAVDIATGVEQWVGVVGSLRSAPAVIGGFIYIGTNNGVLIAVGGSGEGG